MAMIDLMMAQGEYCDPLTPVERTILDLLLKKKARAESASKAMVKAESKATCSVVKKENPADGPKSASEDKPAGSPKKTRFSPRLQQKAPETVTDQESADDNLDDFSEGPLNDEQLDNLMREFNIGSGDEDSQESDNPTHEAPYRAVGRGCGRGRGRGGAGRGSKTTRGTHSSIRTPWSKHEDGDVGDSDCVSKGNESSDQHDPITAGYEYLKKMSDDQVIQHMNTYKEEKKIGIGDNVDSDDFAAWLSRKLPTMAVTKPVPSSTRGRQSGKVVFEGKGPTHGGSRGRGGPPPKGRRVTRQSFREDF